MEVLGIAWYILRMSSYRWCPVLAIVFGLKRSCESREPYVLVAIFSVKVYEVSAADGSDVSGGPVTTSHFEGELTGLARHPKKAEFVTAGGDGTVGNY